MTIRAKIILDSVSPEGIRLTTFQLMYPRFIHSEVMTHRVFSRNASSSRAIPIRRLIRETVSHMAFPEAWGSNKPGMQAGAELTGFRRWLAKTLWKGAGYAAATFARGLAATGVHKQIANRIIEPWSHIHVVVTATDWNNWWALRYHPDADPTMQALAAAMHYAYENSEPQLLQPGEWHLPYVSEHEADLEHRIMMSAARCARVSYLTHDKKVPSMEADLELYERLVGSDPKHASPVEHQGTPDKLWTRGRWAKPEQHGNFRGWRQHRKMIPGEAVFG